MYIVDDESWPIPDETKRIVFNKTVNLSPGHPRGSVHLEECVGGEVRVEVDFKLSLAADYTMVRTDVEARLYEGTSCSTNDLEDSASGLFITPKDRSTTGEFNLKNSGFGGGDKADITFTIVNTRQP